VIFYVGKTNNNHMKIYHNEVLLNPKPTKKQKAKNFFKKLLFVIIASVIVWIAMVVGSHAFPVTVFNTKEVIVEVDQKAPIMAKIAQCESENKHFGKSGQVIMVGNKNGTVDVGRYQINTVHFAQATTMGLDLTKELDNEKFAFYLYKTQGTEPWVYSKHCWR